MELFDIVLKTYWLTTIKSLCSMILARSLAEHLHEWIIALLGT